MTASAHEDSITSYLSVFEKTLSSLMDTAKAKVIARLLSQLTLSDGEIERSEANMLLLRRIPTLLLSELRVQGYQELIEAFVEQFHIQIADFGDILATTLKPLDTAKLAALVKFTPQDTDFLAQLQVDSVAAISDVISAQLNTLRHTVLMSVGGMKPTDLSTFLSEKLDIVPGIANNVATTAISTFYRTIADLGYQKIEAESDLTFKYVGPPSTDPVERPFCKHLMRQTEAGKTFTRAEIDEMDNGQLPDVFATGGGYSCRHSWLIATVKPK